MTLKEIQERRSELYRAMCELQDVATRDNDGDFTAEQREQWDKLNAEYDDLGKQEREARGETTGRTPLAIDERTNPAHRSFNIGGSEVRTIRDATGRDMPCLGREHRLADHVKLATHEPRDIDQEAVWRGILRNDWSGASAEQRLLSGNIDASGGYALPGAATLPILDYARNSAAVVKAGAQTIPVATRNFTVPIMESDPVAYLRPEGAAITESEPTVGAWNFTATTCAVLVPLTVELVEDCSDLFSLVQSAIGSVIALKLDHQCLYGSGALGVEATGLRYQDNVHENTVAGALTHDHISEMIEDIRESNGTPNAWITHPSVAGDLERQKDGQGLYLRRYPESVEGLAKHATNQVAKESSSSEMFVADWRSMLIGLRTDMRLEIFRSGSNPAGSGDAVSKMLTYIRAYSRFDSCHVRPTHAGRLLSITV